MERRDEHVPFLVRMESIHQALVQIRRDIEETAIGPTEMRRMGGRTGARHHRQPVEGLLLWEREREVEQTRQAPARGGDSERVSRGTPHRGAPAAGIWWRHRPAWPQSWRGEIGGRRAGASPTPGPGRSGDGRRRRAKTLGQRHRRGRGRWRGSSIRTWG